MFPGRNVFIIALFAILTAVTAIAPRKVIDRKYDKNTAEDEELFKKIPSKEKKRAMIPISAIADAEWSEHGNYADRGIDFKYDEHFSAKGMSTDMHLKEIQHLKDMANLLKNRQGVDKLQLRGT